MSYDCQSMKIKRTVFVEYNIVQTSNEHREQFVKLPIVKSEYDGESLCRTL